LSVHGLRKLQRERPGEWASTMASYLPDPPALTPEMTVRTAITAGVLDWQAMQRLGPSALSDVVCSTSDNVLYVTYPRGT
jgi:hypothetical protein